MANYIKRVYQQLEKTFAHEGEFLQAVQDFFEAIESVVESNPDYEKYAILEKMVEAERIISFQVPWLDDNNRIQVNRAYRVQFNSANGPYKGGIRFHPTVNQSILKFLGFEQTFKNSLTGLAIGGAKGGSDFDPRNRSESEIMRFCNSFMIELSKYIGPDFDIPSGDIGVGQREVNYLYGQYKRLKGPHLGVFTGKAPEIYGSFARTEATGYGLVYFLIEMLKADNQSLEGKRVIISGSGNVAYYAAMKVTELGGIVVSMSDSDHAIYCHDGVDLNKIKSLKIDSRQRIKQYADMEDSVEVHSGSVWDIDIDADIALPCATQNEINAEQAHRLAKNGIKYVAEGGNMPSNSLAIKVYKDNGITFAPGKAANAGGVSVSALEMSQNAQKQRWTFEEVDNELKNIMQQIFIQCENACQKYDLGKDYAAAADIAAFERVAQQMIKLGMN